MSRRGLKLSEQVAQDIVADVARTGMAPGDRLPNEVIMADRYDVSRATLREALRILEVHGLIVIRSGPGGGPELLDVGPPDFGRMATLFFHSTGVTFRQLLDARCIFEPLVAELAAKQRTEEDVNRLLANVAGPVDRTNAELVTERSHEFHSLVASMAGNQILTLVTSSLHGIFRVYSEDSYSPQALSTIIKVHERIARAIAEGAAPEARRLMEKHMQASATDFERSHPTLVSAPVPWLIA